MADVLKAHDPNTMPGNGSPSKAKKGKRMSVERIYQKKTQREHILLRPDSYIGATESTVKSMWVWDEETRSIVMKEITYSPGLYKIFDEVLVNAADNKQRDPSMNMIKINIDVEKNVISIWNNGKGIPIEMHAEQKVYVPTLIFGQLLTSSNYDDTQKKITGGRNGFGAKLCNIYSKKFSIETACGEYGKKFKQVWKDNMTTASEPIIKENKGTDFTCVTFSPDLPRFHMEKLTNDMVALLKRRAYDVAGSSRGVTVLLNGEKLNVKNFKDYVDLYVKNVQKDGERLKVVHEVFNKRWEICVTVSENGFQQASFVNSIATTKGGTHTNYIVDQIVQKMVATVKRKASKELNIKPFQIKNHLWVFVNCLIENPCFDSQTKENMTLNQKSFGSTCELNEKFIKSVQGCGVLDSIMNWVKFKTQEKLNSKCSGQKKTKLKGIAKLDDANDAGGAKSRDCTLILTEGDSAKTLAISGLGIIGRDKYGVFPLRGKLLNVREATSKQIMENAEINNIVKIVGLQYKKKYESDGDLKTLRYGRIMIMTDQDQDGSHIKGLLINFIHHNWPSLLHMKFLEEFITPIVKVAKGGQSLSFYSLPELEEWKQETANAKSWKVKYYKGLGTSTSKEAKEYFTDMKRHRIKFDYDGPSSDQAIELAFSKKMIGGRKDWLTSGMEERKRRRELGMPEIYLYGKDTRTVSYTDFVNKELILFSNADNERSIPSLVDGLKPGQRKVMFTCLKRNDKREVKVAQLAGSIAELSAYHHGETSLMGTIVNLAQNYVGSNNINLLQPIGQFGTRINGGKDSASPRYIFTMLSPLARMIFPEKDDPLLKNNYDDGLKIEPEWYCPILPMVLVNGAEGIGTGWSTKVPNYDPREIVANIKRMIDGEAIQPMFPWYKNFTGTIEQTEPQKYNSIGTFQVIDDAKIEITELPIRTWTSNYKDSVLEPYLHGTEKVKPLITDYRDCSSDKTVDFIISMQENDLAKAEQEGIAKKFKLESSIACTSMVLFDANGVLRKYDSVEEILKDFFEVRRQKYRERKAYLKGMLEAEASKLENQARFILEKIDGDVAIENKSKRDLVTMLVEMNYLSDPVKTWKNTLVKDVIDSDSESGIASEAGSVISGEGGPDFNYILNMNLWSLSRERKEQLLAERDRKKEELAILMKKSPEDLWLEDLDTFSAELDRIEEIEREEDLQIAKNASKGKAMRQQTLKRPAVKKEMKKKAIKTEVQEKKKKENKETEKKEIEEINDEKRSIDLINDNASTTSSGILSLAERLALKKDGATQKKQSRLSFDGVKKKKKLTMPVSDEEDTFDISDDGDDFMLAKKKKAPTLKRTKPTLTFEAEESEGENSEVERTKELIKRLTPVKPKKSAVTLESGSDNLTNGEKSTKEGAAKKGKKAKKDLLDVISDSGSEQEFDKDSEKYSMKEGSEKGSDSEICILEEESSPPAQKKKAPVKKPPAKKAPAKKTKTAAGASKPRAKKADKKDAKDGKQMTLFASAAKATAKRKPTFLPESDDDVDDEKESKPASNKTAPKDEAEPKAKKMKTKATKPAAPKKKRVIESDDDDDDKFSFDEPMQPSPAKPTRAARTNRAKVKYNFDESDGEDKEKSYHVGISDDDDDDDDDYDSDF